MAKHKADLDLHKLEIFYWVAEHKSFSQAAELLSLRQPTISAHVQELEKAVGGKLLYRIPGKVSLTPLGLMLAERAKNLLAFKRATVVAVEQFHGTLSGELWVGGSSIPGEYLLPQKLGEFTKKYPHSRSVLSALKGRTHDFVSQRFGATKWCWRCRKAIHGANANLSVLPTFLPRSSSRESMVQARLIRFVIFSLSTGRLTRSF
ncbi:MAG: transcriptional regulator, LysR family [Deltaproteobacteria bacterium]|nr:transcriptional regulator, LysR family [Deltaproteobacteria bacterium]